MIHKFRHSGAEEQNESQSNEVDKSEVKWYSLDTQNFHFSAVS